MKLSNDPGKDLKIPRVSPDAWDPAALALSALGWVLGDDIRAGRFLTLTGLTPEALRAGLVDGAMRGEILGAVLDYLGAHEPDLVAAADALAVPPQALIAARVAFGGALGGELA